MVKLHTRLLKILVAISATFVLFQLWVLRASWMKSEKTDDQKSRKKRRFDHWKPAPDYMAVHAFASVASRHNVPVFLMEPHILQTVWHHRMGRRFSSASDCRFLCQNSSSTAFGIISNKWISQNFLDALEKKGFRLSTVRGKDPRLLSVNELVPPEISYHHFFLHGRHLIQLVIFYERNSTYLWHGHIPIEAGNSSLVEVNYQDLQFGVKHAGAFNKMEFTDIHIDDVSLTLPKYPIPFLKQLLTSRHMDCNFQQARKFISQYGEEETPQADEFRTRAREIVERGSQALDQLGIPFWISSGTCLGWFRECNIISHSMDVDFGMKIRDYNNRVVSSIENHGLQLLHQFGKKEDSFELSFARGSVKLDIFFFYEEEDYIWNGGTDVKTGNKYKYSFPKFDLCWTELLGLKLRVPCPTLSYIEANYGKEWSRKVTEWNWKESPPNVRRNGRWAEEEWPMVMQTFPVM